MEHEDEQDLQQALAATKSAQDALAKRRRSNTPGSALKSPKGVAGSLSLTSIGGDFDDTDFDVPSVTLPTLEDILAEKDNDDFLADIDAVVAGATTTDGGAGGDTSGTGKASESVNSMSASAPVHPSSGKSKTGAATTTVHGSVLRYSRLKNLAAHLHSASSRVDAGLPTAMAVSSSLAVGTSHGLVLMFDPSQALKLVLGNGRLGQQLGPVSALDFNGDMTRLLVGHAKGTLTMWDLGNGKCIRTITDAHVPGTPVLHVRFLDDPTQAVFSDSGGSVFLLQFRRVMGVRTAESDCLFSGSRGEVCCVQPLLFGEKGAGKVLAEMRILAMASLTKVFIVRLRPKLEVMFTFSLKGELGTLPLLDWHLLSGDNSSVGKTVEPLLVAARGNQLVFHRLRQEDGESGNVAFIPIKGGTVSFQCISVKLLNSEVVVMLDTREHIHVFDYSDMTELQDIDLVDVHLAYSTSHFKSLAAGGSVSKALEVASQHSCYQSIATYRGQLLLLGVDVVHCLTIRKWDERLAVLVRDSQFPEALALAMTFYRGTARAIIGLSSQAEERREVVAGHMIDILLAYVDLSLAVHIPDDDHIEEQENFYKGLVNICIDYCLILDATDLLFSDLYERFVDFVIGRACFLECLEPYIIGDHLTSLSPVVLRDFIEHYQTQQMLQRVENCLLHLEVHNLDLHQVVVLCWTYGLYDAMIYVYTRGMHDYATPLQELLRLLRSALNSQDGGGVLSDGDQVLGYKLLVYISCCLAGRAYPSGEIADDIAATVRSTVFSVIVKKQLNEAEADDQVESFPHLRTLLRFDTREFLNVLSLAFEEDFFSTVSFRDTSTGQAVQRPGRQLVVDLLLRLMMNSRDFSPSQLGSLFTFLARQMAKHNDIKVQRQLFEQVLEFLCNPDSSTRHEERQQAMLELLSTNIAGQFDAEQLIVLCESASFFQVLEQLYERRREFAKVLSCYWRDPTRRAQAFSYIHHVMLDDSFVEFERAEVEQAALKHMQELMEADSLATAKLMITDFAHDLEDVTNRLSEHPKLQYEFLLHVFGGPGGVGLAKPESPPPPQVHEQYIELMCKYDPTLVYSYLRSNENYRLEETLMICRKHLLTDAVAFLLERTGDVQGAFNLLLKSLRAKISFLDKTVDEYDSDSENIVQVETVRVAITAINGVLLVIIQLCQRNSVRLEAEQRQDLWFPLLEAAMSPQQRWRHASSALVSALKELTSHVLNSMMGYVPLPAILKQILSDPSTSSGSFGELKDLMMGMVETYSYEQTLLTTTNRLLAGDINGSISVLKRVKEKGLAPRSAVCSDCGRRLWESNTAAVAAGRSSSPAVAATVGGSVKDKDDIYVFSCGHSYHRLCVVSRQPGIVACGICNKKLSTSTSRQADWHRIREPPRTHSDSTVATPVSGAEKPLGAKPNAAGAREDGNASAGLVQRVDAVARLHSSFRTGSRLQILHSLNRHNTSSTVGSSSRGGAPAASSSSDGTAADRFQLNLAPPPL
ncbi:vacuolar protein sorting-associated protein 8 homolog [Sycon ciliatum]|uniref:vacuolar protein sorting-associated protein 8 homolog n=1 Tax=Sycon ciliatum TaxID=27933 RepID=UPI0031F6C8E1